MVLVLAVSDEVDNALYADVGSVRDARLIVACGDRRGQRRAVRRGCGRPARRRASLRYSDGPNQYTQRQQTRRARSLARRARWRAARDGGGVDVLLTHAPPRGVGDREDRPHQGFEALHWPTARLQPSLLLHGHIHPDETPARIRRLGRTVVRNVAGRHLLDIEPGAGVRRSPAGSRYAR